MSVKEVVRLSRFYASVRHCTRFPHFRLSIRTKYFVLRRMVTVSFCITHLAQTSLQNKKKTTQSLRILCCSHIDDSVSVKKKTAA